MNAHSPLKAKPLRNPGQSLDEKIRDLLDDRGLPYILFPVMFWVMTAAEWFAAYRGLPRNPSLYLLIAIVFTAASALGIWRLVRRLRALRLGRDGERAVGQFLEGLRVNGARIFHDVPADGFNLDHVVISSHGIYVIETKTLTKPRPDAKVTFDGSTLLVAGRTLGRDPIRQARAEAAWLVRFLKESTGKELPVRPVVVFPGWWIESTEGAKGSDVWVLEPKALPHFIEREPVQLVEDVVTMAAYHLSRYIRTS